MLAVLCESAWAQSGQPGIFHEPATGLVLRYPVELTVQNAQKSINEGHIAIYGSMQNAAKEHELAGRCFTPILLAELPCGEDDCKQSAQSGTITLFMFEFTANKECKAGFKYKDNERVAGGIAQTARQLPGATVLSQPLYFDFGKHKLHVTLAAIGLQNASADQPHSLIACTKPRRLRPELAGKSSV